jgi:hypothetical protein
MAGKEASMRWYAAVLAAALSFVLLAWPRAAYACPS